MFNIFTPDMDLAVIKPRWTNKHEFSVDLPKNTLLDTIIEPDELQDDNLLQSNLLSIKENTSGLSF